MTLTPKTSDRPREMSAFRVGNFALFPTRNCQQAREHFGLSQREVELVMHVGRGLTKQEIADRMGVSPATADTFRRRAYVKLGVHTGSAAASIIAAYLAGSRVEARAAEDVD